MKNIDVIKRMPTRHEMEVYKKRKKKDAEIIGGVCMAIIVVAAGLLLIG